jgi:hypothetical protein
MRLRRSAALAVLSVATILPLVGSTVAARGPDPAAARAAAEHARIVAFWTPERMKTAVPRDFRYDPASGRFHLVPNAKPGGGGTGGNTTGASWPNGRGKVYQSTGKVYFQMNGSGWVCSGTALGDSRNSYSLVITAGHCVYDEENGNGRLSGFATNWLFIPQYDSNPTLSNCANTAYGCWTAAALVVNDGFASAGGFTTTATHYDWGFAVVGNGGNANSQLDSVVAPYGYAATAMSANTVVDAFGYPAAQKYHGNDLVYCQGPIGFDSLAGNGAYKLACGMTGGSSGGPWFSGFDAATGNGGTIQSLNSYGYSGQSNMYGPIFNPSTTQTYNAANSATTNTIVP